MAGRECGETGGWVAAASAAHVFNAGDNRPGPKASSMFTGAGFQSSGGSGLTLHLRTRYIVHYSGRTQFTLPPVLSYT